MEQPDIILEVKKFLEIDYLRSKLRGILFY